MDLLPERNVEFERLRNFRDFGGYPAAGGRWVRRGLLYRSDSLGKLRDRDLERFAALRIRTVIDLRYPWEIEAGGRVPDAPGLSYFNCCIEHRPWDQSRLSADIDPIRFVADRYAEVAADGAEEIGQALQIIAAGDGPLVIHCASGKDRTGLVAALVLALLGVADDDIAADYALTELATERLRADWRAAHPGRDLVWPFFARAPREVMELAWTELIAKHGSARDYVTGYLRQPERLIEQLRAVYLTPGLPDHGLA
jgi:protein-tyrosine phosphatase